MQSRISLTYYDQLFSRNLGIISSEDQERLRGSRVAIAGVGGVGGDQLVNLARAGVGAFRIADPEVFGLSDRNRQYGALESTLQVNKAEVMSALVKDINPECEVVTFADGINAENIEAFMDGCDVVIDAVEYFTVVEKLRLYRTARKMNKYVFTAPIIGLGTTMMAFAPDGMTYEGYFEYHEETGQVNAQKFCPVFPEYIDINVYREALERKRPIPSFPVSCALSGTLLAAEVLLFLLEKRPPVVVPQVIVADLFRRSIDIIDNRWSAFWTDFSQEVYDYIAQLPDNKRLLDRVAELSGEGQQVLDAGCGTGNLTTRLAERHAQVTAIDFSEGMVAMAQVKTQPYGNVAVSEGDVTELAFPDGSFDAVTSVNVLFNLDRPEQAIKEMGRVLKPQGKLIISSLLKGRGLTEEHRRRVLNDSIANNISQEQLAQIWKYQVRLAAGGGFKYTPEEAEIRALLTANGFTILSEEEAYYQTNFLIVAVKGVGDRI